MNKVQKAWFAYLKMRFNNINIENEEIVAESSVNNNQQIIWW